MQLNVNGSRVDVSAAAPNMPLLWILREHLGLTGAKYGCGQGVCGSCMVSVDGAQVHSCMVTLAQVQGKQVVTIEGQQGPIADALFAAWDALAVAQCGFCQAGQINSAAILLAHNPQPTDADIDAALKHNLCRCGTYVRIRKAVHQAAQSLSTHSAQEAT
jgi:isoquinoline 1-oxidoreductase alpha subunit